MTMTMTMNMNMNTTNRNSYSFTNLTGFERNKSQTVSKFAVVNSLIPGLKRERVSISIARYLLQHKDRICDSCQYCGEVSA
jgi:myo-inositol-1-phosphate synthase